MMVNKKYDHWWEWAGEFTKDAMKGWGLGALSFMAVLAAVIYLGIMHGGNYLDAGAEKMRAEAKTANVVADAMTKLTKVAEVQEERTATLQAEVAINGMAIKEMIAEGSLPAQQVREMMEAATKLMLPVPALRQREYELMTELLDVQKEVLQTLQDQSKNAQAPPITNDGGA
jgi:hypothetical protein